MLVRDVRLRDRVVDLLLRDGVVVDVGPALAPSGDIEILEGAGCTALPGLHDHHIHVLATAAARASVGVGPGEARDAEGFAEVLRRADATLPRGVWLRAVGYHESVAGPIDRDRLDALVPHRPVRVQHRTGSRWILNSAGLALLDLDQGHPGVERDLTGRPTGRLRRADNWLRGQITDVDRLDLAALGTALASKGITGVTDATPFRSVSGPGVLADAVTSGALPQHVVVMGGIELLDVNLPSPLRRGPVKIVVDDPAFPAIDELAADMHRIHDHGRSVAIHCVTRASVVVALAAWAACSSKPGDRIEHGSVVPPELHSLIIQHGLTVVTQPAFVSERGDQYLVDVDPDDIPHLYPCQGLLSAGVEVAAGSDAPYTDIDPWAAMRAAVTRRTRSGRTIGPKEAVSPARALALYLGDPTRPGGPAREIRPGAPADIVLVDGDPPSRIDHLRADRVVATIIAGRRVW